MRAGGYEGEITVFDEHHEALLFWDEVFLSKKAPRTLLHVDGHSDMGTPWLTESVYTKDVAGLVERQLSIANFIIPAVIRGYFDNVIFLGRGVEEKGRQKRRIGSLYGEGVWIKGNLKKDKLTRRLFPDAKEWHYAVVADPASVPKKPVVLDIDLDYFCGYCLNYSNLSVPLTARQARSVNRLFRSNDKYRVFLNLLNIEDGVVKPEGYPKFKDIIYNGSEAWIECAIRYFVTSLSAKPERISICRSVKSGYTPASLAGFTEKTLIGYLSGRRRRIDPRDIPGPLEIYPYVASEDNTLYVPLTDDVFPLNGDARFIWRLIREGKSFSEIIEAMLKVYDLSPEVLVDQVVRFIFYLKKKFVLK